jgi:hypothetical protein
LSDSFETVSTKSLDKKHRHDLNNRSNYVKDKNYTSCNEYRELYMIVLLKLLKMYTFHSDSC